MPDPIDPSEWQLDPRSLELVHRATGERIGITDAHVDALLGFEPGTAQAMIRQYNGIVGSPLGLSERVSELLRRTELPGVVDIGASLAEELVRRGPVERAAELMGARGVGWTRMERILRALMADVDALWTGPMGRAGGRAGWTLAREALSMVQSAGLGALSEARAAQLAGALLGLLDKGTLDHAALLGAVGRLIRQWMEQGEPRPEEPRPEEPRPEEPRPEEPRPEEPRPEEPLFPEHPEHPTGDWDILGVFYDVDSQVIRLALLRAGFVQDMPGVEAQREPPPALERFLENLEKDLFEHERLGVQDSGWRAELEDQVRRGYEGHVVHRFLRDRLGSMGGEFITPAPPDLQGLCRRIVQKYDLGALIVLRPVHQMPNPTLVEEHFRFEAHPIFGRLRAPGCEVARRQRICPAALGWAGIGAEVRYEAESNGYHLVKGAGDGTAWTVPHTWDDGRKGDRALPETPRETLWTPGSRTDDEHGGAVVASWQSETRWFLEDELFWGKEPGRYSADFKHTADFFGWHSPFVFAEREGSSAESTVRQGGGAFEGSTVAGTGATVRTKETDAVFVENGKSSQSLGMDGSDPSVQQGLEIEVELIKDTLKVGGQLSDDGWGLSLEVPRLKIGYERGWSAEGGMNAIDPGATFYTAPGIQIGTPPVKGILAHKVGFRLVSEGSCKASLEEGSLTKVEDRMRAEASVDAGLTVDWSTQVDLMDASAPAVRESGCTLRLRGGADLSVRRTQVISQPVTINMGKETPNRLHLDGVNVTMACDREIRSGDVGEILVGLSGAPGWIIEYRERTERARIRKEREVVELPDPRYPKSSLNLNELAVTTTKLARIAGSLWIRLA